jgi:gas vesicle protein
MGGERYKVVDPEDPCAAVQKILARYEGVKTITPEEYEDMLKTQGEAPPETKLVPQPSPTTKKTESASEPEACRISRSEDGGLVLEGPCGDMLKDLLEYLGIETGSGETSEIVSKIEEISKEISEQASKIKETIEETLGEKLEDVREAVEEVIEEKFEELMEELEEGLEEDYEEEEYWE